MSDQFQITTFYEFRPMPSGDDLMALRNALRAAMAQFSVKGTIILAGEGFNGTVCGRPTDVTTFTARARGILDTEMPVKTSFHSSCPFRRIDVKIKPEIVTLKQVVDITIGEGTHIAPSEWNKLISDPDTLLLDARNYYEVRTGKFPGAIDPGTRSFSELPHFVEQNLDPLRHKRIAMYCTGGIRCEKLAPFVKQLGFNEVFQLEGGILRYLAEISPEESLWQGECFVFDDRITVDDELVKGALPDASQPGRNVDAK
jgi:UPF0176 protein